MARLCCFPYIAAFSNDKPLTQKDYGTGPNGWNAVLFDNVILSQLQKGHIFLSPSGLVTRLAGRAKVSGFAPGRIALFHCDLPTEEPSYTWYLAGGF